MNAEETQHLRELIDAHTRRLRQLEIQAAKLGTSSPPHITNEIEDITRRVEGLRRQATQTSTASYQDVRTRVRTLDDRLKNVQLELERLVIREERIYRLFGIPIWSVTILRIIQVLVACVGIGLVAVLTNQLLQTIARPTPTPTLTPTTNIVLTPEATLLSSTAGAIAPLTQELPMSTLKPPTLTPTRMPTLTPMRIPTLTPTRIPTLTPTRMPTRTLRQFDANVRQSYSTEGSASNRQSCIIGRVLGKNGRGVANAILYANNGVANTEQFTTNSSGEYSYCKLGESTWSIVLTFIPQPNSAFQTDLDQQVVAIFTVNGNPDHIATVDFVER